MTRLIFDGASDGWLDSLPLGNGRLGAMVSSHCDGVSLHLNDGTAWSGSPASTDRHPVPGPRETARARARARALFDTGQVVAAERALAPLQQGYAQAYLPLAALHLRHNGADSLRRELDLAEAIHTLHGDHHGPRGWQHETFISGKDGALVHRLQSRQPLDISLTLSSPLRQTRSGSNPRGLILALALPADVAPSHEPDQPAIRWQIPGCTTVQAVVVVRIRHDGADQADDGAAAEPGVPQAAQGPDHPVLQFRGARTLEVVLTTGTTFTAAGLEPATDVGPILDRTRERADTVLATGFSDLRVRHRNAHRALWDRVSIRLGSRSEDPVQLDATSTDLTAERAPGDGDLLTALFDFGRYLLISSSTPGGLPITLQGLWNDQMQPPWSSAYTMNINLQMCYWAAVPLALGELTDPLLDFTEALARRGAETAQRLYGARGWVAHHNSDAWAFTAPTNGQACWSHWAMGGVWLVTTLDRHRQYGHAEPAWLERMWALARGACEFGLDLLHEGADGNLVTFPSTSPENTYNTMDGPAALTLGSGMDRGLLRELFGIVSDLAEATGRSGDEVASRAREAMARVQPPVIATDGRIREWGQDAVDAEPEHRHLSHLVFAYPGPGAMDDDLAEAVSRTLDARGEESTGWSLAWKLALRARLGQPDQFASLLSYVLRPAIPDRAHAGGLYPNLFAAHPPFQIDGNLGYTAAWCEALAGSDGERITLLPGLPPDLTQGRVHGLRVRPGIVVSFTWSQGRPERIHLRALHPAQAGTYTLEHLGQRMQVRVPVRGQTLVDWREATAKQEDTA